MRVTPPYVFSYSAHTSQGFRPWKFNRVPNGNIGAGPGILSNCFIWEPKKVRKSDTRGLLMTGVLELGCENCRSGIYLSATAIPGPSERLELAEHSRFGPGDRFLLCFQRRLRFQH